MKKLRLMQITHDLAIGGLQQVIVNICRAIDRDRFDVSVLCLRELGEFAPEVESMGIKVFCLPQNKNSVDYLSFLKVARILKDNKIDIIHTHNTQPFVDGTIAALLSGVKTVIHTDHARHFPDKRRYMFAEWLMSHFAYRVVGVSDKTCQDLINYERISPRRIMTIVNGIDGSRCRIKIDKAEKRKSLGIPGSGPIIGVASRLEKQKGISYLLKALPSIRSAIPEATIAIAGQGGDLDDLKKEAIELGIADDVFFLGPRLDIPELLKLFDLCAMPSNWEGLPMIVLEALAAGCPVVATDVGGLSTAITHGINGSLIPPRNPDALAEEIVKILRDASLREKYIANGYHAFEKSFSAAAMTAKYQQLYLREL